MQQLAALATALDNAVGLLKEEMRRLGSLVLAAADAAAVPAGPGARGRSRRVRAPRSPRRDRGAAAHRAWRATSVDALPDARSVVLATGPLTSARARGRAAARWSASESLYFYDAISPIVYADSLDHDVAFRASRYEDGEGDYLNLPLDARGVRGASSTSCVAAETVPLHPFEAALYFEGCLPIEEMARRGRDTLAFGPMKPVGLAIRAAGAGRTRSCSSARRTSAASLYNLVGFQTKLRVGEQQRIFRTLPGAREAVFARYGSVHRNTFVNAPRLLAPTLELRARPGLLLRRADRGRRGLRRVARRSALLAGIYAAYARARRARRRSPTPTTAHGALLRHLREADARSTSSR